MFFSRSVAAIYAYIAAQIAALTSYVDTQDLTKLRYVDRGDPAAYDFVLANFTTDGTWREKDVSSIVPANAKLIHVKLTVRDDAANSEFSLDGYGKTNHFTSMGLTCQVNNVWVTGEVTVPMTTAQKILYYATNTTFSNINLLIKGWWIP